MGEGEGAVIFAPDTPVSALQPSSYISLPGRARYSILPVESFLNEIGPTGAHAVRAKVYYAESWFDQKQAIIPATSKTSLLAHWMTR
jgi:hypothetical protein